MSQIILGNHSYSASNPVLAGVMSNVIVGKYCSIASGVIFDCGWNHRNDCVSTYPFNKMWNMDNDTHPYTNGDIIIENDVWIGQEAVVKSGVKIHNGAIVGFRSVVTRDVPAYAIVAGIPAKVIRYRFTKKQINNLLKIKWWDWHEHIVREHVFDLMSNNIDEFLKNNLR